MSLLSVTGTSYQLSDTIMSPQGYNYPLLGGRIFQTCHNVTMHIHDWHWNIIAMIKESVALTSVRPNTQNRTAGEDWGGEMETKTKL